MTTELPAAAAAAAAAGFPGDGSKSKEGGGGAREVFVMAGPPAEDGGVGKAVADWAPQQQSRECGRQAQGLGDCLQPARSASPAAGTFHLHIRTRKQQRRHVHCGR